MKGVSGCLAGGGGGSVGAWRAGGRVGVRSVGSVRRGRSGGDDGDMIAAVAWLGRGLNGPNPSLAGPKV